MKQYLFETNIESRMPHTGKVYFVDRMTSGYAIAHPFDVDGFVHEVAEKHGADEERVRLFFNYGLGKMGEKFSTHCPCKHKDKIKVDKKSGIGELVFGKYPSYVNGPEPALVEAWLKGVEYHTKGLRMGDVLPAVAPACKITRTGDGEWIALFPKDMQLLDEPEACYSEPAGLETPTPSVEPEAEPEPEAVEPEAVEPEPEPAEEKDNTDLKLKIVAALATAAVVLVLVNCVGLFGVAAFGLIAGGLLK